MISLKNISFFGAFLFRYGVVVHYNTRCIKLVVTGGKRVKMHFLYDILYTINLNAFNCIKIDYFKRRWNFILRATEPDRFLNTGGV